MGGGGGGGYFKRGRRDWGWEQEGTNDKSIKERNGFLQILFLNFNV